MSTPQLEFKTILAGVRPPRVAVLLNEADEDWQWTVQFVVEWASQCWGGRHFIIVPTDGVSIQSHFWNILKAYDPDYLYTYRRTIKDWEVINPERFRGELNARVDGWMQEHGSEDREQIESMLEPLFRREHLDQFDISAGLSAELKRNLAPFHHEQRVILHSIQRGSAPGYPLSEHLQLLPKSRPERMTDIRLPVEDECLRAYMASASGLVPPQETLNRTNMERMHGIVTSDDKRWLANLLLDGRLAPDDSLNVERIDVDSGSVLSRMGQFDFSKELPFALSMAELAYFRQHGYEDWKTPIFVVFGSSLHDYCLYYDLARVHGEAIWLPDSWMAAVQQQQLTEFPSDLLLDLLHVADHRIRFDRQGASFIGLSAGKTEADMRTATSALVTRLHLSHSALADCGYPPDIANLVKRPRLVYERENAQRPTVLPFLNGEIGGFFETPKPKNFQEIRPQDHRWITEFEFEGYKLPRSPHLGDWIVRGMTVHTTEARVGKYGVAYFCPGIIVTGSAIDENLIRPKLVCPDAPKVFSRIAQRSEYDFAASDKGRFSADTIARFGSLEVAARYLRSHTYQPALMKFLDTSANVKNVFDNGAVVRGRRYLDFVTLAKLIPDRNQVAKFIDDMVRDLIFRRGWLFQCEKCRQTDWYAVGTITTIFACSRCGVEQQYTRQHWHRPEEPHFFYALDEIVFHALGNGCAVTIVALDLLRQRSKKSFLYVTESDLSKTGVRMEIDFMAVVDGQFFLGEGKQNTHLGDGAADEDVNIQKYCSLASDLGAEQLLFATMKKAWSEATMNRAASLIGGSTAWEFVAAAELGYE